LLLNTDQSDFNAMRNQIKGMNLPSVTSTHFERNVLSRENCISAKAPTVNMLFLDDVVRLLDSLGCIRESIFFENILKKPNATIKYLEDQVRLSEQMCIETLPPGRGTSTNQISLQK
jgi:hypothetical protein